jgi:ubiquinone/menaquinone biosynthesis C-methylase UbiE
MEENLQLNADRFLGFADVYDNARPKCPEIVTDIALRYLKNNQPELVVDLGCGTGLSTRIWSKISRKVIGVEPSTDMLEIAREKSLGLDNVAFVSAFADNTGLGNNCADIMTCSQSFHWMNPETTLNEVGRVLKKGGVFAVYDYDWPPVSNLEAELEYHKLFEKVMVLESTHPNIKDSFVRWDKDSHLANIKDSGKFRYVREIVFSNSENCNTKRLISLALSQGGLQAIIKANIEEIDPYLTAYQEKISEIFGNTEFKIDFCYRLRLGIK